MSHGADYCYACGKDLFLSAEGGEGCTCKPKASEKTNNPSAAEERWNNFWFLNGGSIHGAWKHRRWGSLRKIAQTVPKLAWDKQQEVIDELQERISQLEKLTNRLREKLTASEEENKSLREISYNLRKVNAQLAESEKQVEELKKAHEEFCEQAQAQTNEDFKVVRDYAERKNDELTLCAKKLESSERKRTGLREVIEKVLAQCGSLHQPIYFMWLRAALQADAEGEK